MKERYLTIPEIGVIAATRGMIGAGAGLLLADKLPPKMRKTVGKILFFTGAASTIPILRHLLRKAARERA